MLTDIFRRVLSAPYIHTENGSSYFFERMGNRLLILFEKSNGVGDWLSNLDFPSVPYRDMQDRWYCHRGFLAVWRDLEAHLSSVILDSSVRSITVAGYSHGGAVAMLCHEFCLFHRPDCKVCGYGFGSPRVIFGEPSDTVTDRFHGFLSVCNSKDAVTHLPPRFLGFRDMGTRLILTPSGEWGIFSSHTPEAYLSGLADYECVCRKRENRG